MSNYYLLNDSHQYYFSGITWQKERNSLTKDNANLLTPSEANNLNIQQFFVKNDSDDKPHLNQNYRYFAFPYELDDEIFRDAYPGHFIANTLNVYMKSRPIYLASTDNDKCCVVECLQLNDDLISILHSPHMNTPFLIFNQDADIFALIDYDLPLQIIGYKPHLKVEIEHYDVIQQGFNDVMQRYGSYTNMPNLFRTYYDFLLPEWFEY